MWGISSLVENQLALKKDSTPWSYLISWLVLGSDSGEVAVLC